MNFLQDIINNTIPTNTRKGHFWITDIAKEVNGMHYQPTAIFVSWEAPAQITQKDPIVLIHGGLLQSTEWMTTPDGRPGWQQRLVENGYIVFNVDRVGHGRSHTSEKVWGNKLTPFSYETGKQVFFPEQFKENHTQWPIKETDQETMDAFLASFTELPADLATSQQKDAELIGKLLEKIGPSIVFTHSASGPIGWHIANEKRSLVKAIVTIEPMGPAFAEVHGLGKMKWGWTAYPLTYQKEFKDITVFVEMGLDKIQVPAFDNLPIAIVTGSASPFTFYVPELINFLQQSKANVFPIDLEKFGILGNGHGLIYEKNSDQILDVVLQWLQNLK